MELIAIIEIPKGCDRRIHLHYNKKEFVDLGPIKEIIPINKGVMPIHYGFIKNTINRDEEEKNEELDVLVYSDQKTKTGQKIIIEPIAIIHRADKDEKIVAVEKGNSQIKSWNDIPEKERKLLLDYFGYKHKIEQIKSRLSALAYIEKSKA